MIHFNLSILVGCVAEWQRQKQVTFEDVISKTKKEVSKIQGQGKLHCVTCRHYCSDTIILFSLHYISLNMPAGGEIKISSRQNYVQEYLFPALKLRSLNRRPRQTLGACRNCTQKDNGVRVRPSAVGIFSLPSQSDFLA